MWIWVIIGIMVESGYKSGYKGNLFDMSFKNIYSGQDIMMNEIVYNPLYSYEKIEMSNLNKINNCNFGVYSIEFLSALPFPACEALWYIGRLTYFPGSVSGSFSDYLLAGVGHVGLNILFVDGSIHLIGTLTKKEGNLKNSIIGTTIASAITFTIMAVTLHERYYQRDPDYIIRFVFPPLIALLPSLSGVIGYNLK